MTVNQHQRRQRTGTATSVDACAPRARRRTARAHRNLFTLPAASPPAHLQCAAATGGGGNWRRRRRNHLTGANMTVFRRRRRRWRRHRTLELNCGFALTPPQPVSHHNRYTAPIPVPHRHTCRHHIRCAAVARPSARAAAPPRTRAPTIRRARARRAPDAAQTVNLFAASVRRPAHNLGAGTARRCQC